MKPGDLVVVTDGVCACLKHLGRYVFEVLEITETNHVWKWKRVKLKVVINASHRLKGFKKGIRKNEMAGVEYAFDAGSLVVIS